MGGTSISSLLHMKETASQNAQAINKLAVACAKDHSLCQSVSTGLFGERTTMCMNDKSATDVLGEVARTLHDYVDAIDRVLDSTKVEWPPEPMK